MAKRDAAAVDVDLLGIELQLADAGDCLRGESLVQLDEIDLIDCETGAFERLLGRRYGTKSHAARIYTRHGGRDDTCGRFACCCGHEESGRAIIDPAGAGGGGPFILLERPV